MSHQDEQMDSKDTLYSCPACNFKGTTTEMDPHYNREHIDKRECYDYQTRALKGIPASILRTLVAPIMTCIMVVGAFGQGKSTLVNSIYTSERGSSKYIKLAPTSNETPINEIGLSDSCTKDVALYNEGDIMFLDTKGFINNLTPTEKSVGTYFGEMFRQTRSLLASHNLPLCYPHVMLICIRYGLPHDNLKCYSVVIKKIRLMGYMHSVALTNTEGMDKKRIKVESLRLSKELGIAKESILPVATTFSSNGAFKLEGHSELMSILRDQIFHNICRFVAPIDCKITVTEAWYGFVQDFKCCVSVAQQLNTLVRGGPLPFHMNSHTYAQTFRVDWIREGRRNNWFDSNLVGAKQLIVKYTLGIWEESLVIREDQELHLPCFDSNSFKLIR